jgi:hypothetical protein
MGKKKISKVTSVGGSRLKPFTARERKSIDKKIRERYQRFRNRYPEVHGKVVDFVTHAIEDGTLYFTVRFKDKTDFSLRYACDMFVVGADICDVASGDFEIIREYMTPLPR